MSIPARCAFVAVLVLFMLLCTGCDDGPDCKRSHTETQWVPVFNGKTTTIHPVFVSVCDEYEETSK
ncbi:hypothetical protein [Streptomyces sp. NRRL S-475]|uniref:hypothetical protein n=1 Tax=Streptomyces sp. NRRL S-475 TaxID=1463910 RepID=UPI0004BD0832|nr:hypothetical protein [Streptomyces sp. NRRL S-475]